MKSYFAKLADRATIANVPATSVVHSPRVSDPFEETSRQETEFATPVSKRLTPPDTRQSRVVRGKSLEPLGIAQTEPHSVETRRRTKEQVTEVKPLEPKLVEASPVRKSTANREIQRPQGVLPVVESQTKRDETESPIKSLSPPETREPGVLRVKDQPAKESDIESEAIGDKVTSLEREQAVLLRKADLFMSNLLDVQHKTQSQNEPPDSRKTEPTFRSTPTVNSESISRLEPVQRQEVPGQESEVSSVVIGNLIVEVTPPATAPPVQQQPQIVIRGSGMRRGGVTSTRRFGLRQF
jgi:hypothetical protein